MKIKDVFLVVGVLIALPLSFFNLFNSKNTDGLSSNNNIAFIELDVVFNSFDMKKELQEDFEKDLQSKQLLLDSIMFELQQLNVELKSSEALDTKKVERFQRLQQYYTQQKQLIDEYAANQTALFDEQILTRMKSYIYDYGSQNGYQLILGSNNNGVVMYGQEMTNITQPIVQFINNSYQGKN